MNMKTFQQINDNLLDFERKFKFKVTHAEQGSTEWLYMKLGVLSASNAAKIIAKKDSQTRYTYMSELVAQVCTGVPDEIHSKYLDWGSEHESAARSSYEFSTGNKVVPLTFVFKDGTYRCGCSPDGLVTVNRGVEIKTPFNAVNYIKFLCDDDIDPDYRKQVQFSIWVMDAGEWDFVQYHPHMKKKPLKRITIPRDEDAMKKFDDLVPEFISDMDIMLKKIGIEFGEQWLRLGKK